MGIKAAAGVSVIVAVAVATLAGTSAGAPAARKLNVAAVTVNGSIFVLNVALTGVFSATPVAFASGVTEFTTGVPLVVKLQVNAVPKGTPAALVTVLATVAV